MSMRFLAITALLAAVLGIAGPVAHGAQQAASPPPKDNPAGMSVKATGRAAEGQRRNRGKPPIPASNGAGILEEIVVMGARIEGSGGRGRATVGREDLDGSDQLDMEGFFDEIDGISTLGADDQGNGFSIDGLSPDLSKVTLDGQGFGEGRGNGGFGAGDLPPEMVRRVNIYKSPAASMEEGGAAGRVNLQLRNPVEIPAPTGNFKGRLTYAPDKGNTSPSGSYFVSRPSEERSSGYMLSVSVTDRASEYGSQDVSKWVPGQFDGVSSYIPNQVRNNAVNNDQSSLFAGLAVGFRPVPSLDIGAKLFLSRQQKATDNQGLQHRIDRQRDISALTFDDRIVTGLESSDPGRSNLRIARSVREDQTDSLLLGADILWRRAGWRLEGAAGFGTVSNESDSPSRSVVFESNSAFAYQANPDGSLQMSHAGGIPVLEAFSTDRINLSVRDTQDRNTFAALDVTRQLGEGVFRRLLFGAKVREMTRSRRSSTARMSLEERLSLADYASGASYRTPWDDEAWMGVNMDRVDSRVQAGPVEWEENILNRYDLKRRSSAAYAQADFRARMDDLRFVVGNIGIRVVGTETWVDGHQAQESGFEPLALQTRYTDVLPSAGLRMRVAQRSVLTLGAARVMTHPAFNDMAPGIRLNYSNKTARSGNPELDPFRANLYLAELTWSPERGRRFRVNLAYRDVSSYFALGEEAVEVDDDTFLVTRPINGQNGSVLTSSLRLDQNLRRMIDRLRNFTFSLAYTRNRSSTGMRDPFSGETLPLPNTADQVLRTELSYERDNFSGKLSHQKRGRSLKSSFSDSGFTVWNAPVSSLNLNLGWKLNEELQFNLDARNLGDDGSIQTTDYGGQLWRINEKDKTVSATLRARW